MKLRIVELDRRPAEIRAESAAARDERDRLTRQVREARKLIQRSFDQGFAACVEMLEHGATVERLRELVKPQHATIARGTRDLRSSSEDDTKPIVTIAQNGEAT